MHPNPFVDEVCVEAMAEGDASNGNAGLDTLLDDLGLEGFGIGTACWLHEIPAAKARTGAHLNLSAHHVLVLRSRVDDLAGRIRQGCVQEVITPPVIIQV